MSAAPTRGRSPGDGSRRLAWTALLLSTALLLASYALPTVEFQRLLSEPEVYSIWGGIEMLWLDGTEGLAAIVFLFSMVFPLAKLIALAWLLLRPRHAGLPARALGWIELLGKWSMLDVFIVGAFVGAIRLQLGPSLQLARGTSHPGIALFGGAVLASMLCTWLVSCCFPAAHARHGDPRARLDPQRLPARLVSTAAAGCLAAALALPLFEVSKGIVFRNQVLLPATTWHMAGDHELLLALTLLLLVMGTSVTRSLLALRLRWLGGDTATLVRRAMSIDEWAMLDVFALGLVVVWVKLDQLATTTVLVGFWCTLAAAALAQLDAWMLRREIDR